MPSVAGTAMGTRLNQNSCSEQFRSTFAHFPQAVSPGAWAAVVGPEHCLRGYLTLEASAVPVVAAVVCSPQFTVVSH